MTQPISRMGYDFSALSYGVIGACQDVQRQLDVHCMEVGTGLRPAPTSNL